MFSNSYELFKVKRIQKRNFWPYLEIQIPYVILNFHSIVSQGIRTFDYPLSFEEKAFTFNITHKLKITLHKQYSSNTIK